MWVEFAKLERWKWEVKALNVKSIRILGIYNFNVSNVIEAKKGFKAVDCTPFLINGHIGQTQAKISILHSC